jgi:hypothetical protein
MRKANKCDSQLYFEVIVGTTAEKGEFYYISNPS